MLCTSECAATPSVNRPHRSVRSRVDAASWISEDVGHCRAQVDHEMIKPPPSCGRADSVLCLALSNIWSPKWLRPTQFTPLWNWNIFRNYSKLVRVAFATGNYSRSWWIFMEWNLFLSCRWEMLQLANVNRHTCWCKTLKPSTKTINNLEVYYYNPAVVKIFIWTLVNSIVSLNYKKRNVIKSYNVRKIKYNCLKVVKSDPSFWKLKIRKQLWNN